MIKITVRLRRIPGDLEILVCGIPLEQICVAENLPAIRQRIGGEILGDDGRMRADRTSRRQPAGQTELFSCADLFNLRSTKKSRNGLTIERPARSLKIKNLQTPQMENEGIHESRRKPFDRLASSFSLTEKLAIVATVIDRRYNNQTSTAKPIS